MPDSKFNFSPESLNIPVSDYNGVRTFAMQVKHVAASNFAIWSPITGDTFPKDFMGGDGPVNLKTKAEILKFLKDSFALGQKIAATLTIHNMLRPLEGSKSTRMRLAVFAVKHALDHLRTDGGIPAHERNCAAC